MPTLVITAADGTEQTADLATELTLGRAEGNDLVLVEGGVSRQHARFFLEGEVAHVEDVGSANGTWVDGERIEGPVPLTPLSQIVIGDYEVALRSGASPAGRPARAPVGGGRGEGAASKGGRAPPARGASPRPPAARGEPAALVRRAPPRRGGGPQLKGLTGSVTGQVFPLRGRLVVGRALGLEIIVEDDSVSRKHAEVEVVDGEVRLRDLGSANGTSVNGAILSKATRLHAGDVVRFGEVELLFEDVAASPPPATRRPGPVVRRPRAPPEDRVPPPREPQAAAVEPGRKRLLVVAGVLAGLLFVAVLAKAFLTSPPPPPSEATPLSPAKRLPGAQALDPGDQIEALLTECRSYASPEVGKPDWVRARAACEKIIELEPIHADANALLRRIQVERSCEENLERGRELVLRGRLEDALDAYAKVGRDGDCPTYFLRALDAAREPLKELKKQAGKECQEYAANGRWENAVKRCEVYTRLACQAMEPSELSPPAGARLKLEGPLGRGEWRPADPLFLDFLKARERLRPGEPLWQCPRIPAFRQPTKAQDPGAAAKDELARRFKDPELGQALVYYFEGKTEAVVPLQKIRENMYRAAEHEQAKALLDDIVMAQNLYQNGLTEIANDHPDRAEAPFRQAMEVDARLVLGDRAAKLGEEEKRQELDRRTSFIRRGIIETMASNCYQRGKQAADHKDFRQACRVWKLGASFSRGNIDLLRALTNVCTHHAEEALPQAQSCVQLRQVLDFAVDGDGYRKQAEDKMAELGCPP
jgi:ABC transport system ATP-binding/permease protein